MAPFNRREFVKSLASALAAGAGSASVQSCATVRSSYLRGGERTSVASVLAMMDRVQAQIEASEGLREAAPWCERHGCSPRLMQDSLISMLTVGAFGDLSVEDRAHPAMQDRLWEMAPVLDRAVLGTTTLLENTSARERASLRHTLGSDPALLQSFQFEFDRASRRERVPSRRLEHLNALINQSAWRLKSQDPSLLIDSLVGKVDKVAIREGITPAHRRELARAWAVPDALAEASRGRYEGSDPLRGASSAQRGGDDYKVTAEDLPTQDEQARSDPNAAPEGSGISRAEALMARGKRTLRTGFIIMGMGAGHGAIGGILLGANDGFSGSEELGWVSVTAGLTLGGVLLITGGVFCMIGGSQTSRARRILQRAGVEETK